MNENLLNELVSESGVSYLSDLHDPRSFRKIFHALTGSLLTITLWKSGKRPLPISLA